MHFSVIAEEFVHNQASSPHQCYKLSVVMLNFSYNYTKSAGAMSDIYLLTSVLVHIYCNVSYHI